MALKPMYVHVHVINCTWLQAVYVGSQSENTPVGTSILSVLARDIDQTGSPNARVEYTLLSGDVDFFDIDPASGVVSNQIVLVSYFYLLLL